MKIKWYEKTEGHTSSMRIMAMMSTVTGCLTVLAGVVGMFLKLPESIAISGVGAGMAGLGELSKAWQAKGEK